MAKAVRIRIVSGGESHSDLESLLRNFAPADLVPAIADGRLARWLQTKNVPSDLFDGLTKLEKLCPQENASSEEKAKFCANLCLRFFSCSCREELCSFFKHRKKLSDFVEFLLGKSEYKKSALGIWEYTLCGFFDIEKLAESAEDAPTRIWNRLELEKADTPYIFHCKGICREKGIGGKENLQEAMEFFLKSEFPGDSGRAEKIRLKEDRTRPFLERLKEFEIRPYYTNYFEVKADFENLVKLCDSWIFKRECDEELKTIAERYLRRWVDKAGHNINVEILNNFEEFSFKVRSFLAGVIMDVEFEKNGKITDDMRRYVAVESNFEDARWLAYYCLVCCSNPLNTSHDLPWIFKAIMPAKDTMPAEDTLFVNAPRFAVAIQVAKRARELDESMVDKIADLMKKNNFEEVANMLSDPAGFSKKMTSGRFFK